jgi:murein DD-endopeptidase MepM/ murein hydrolase activator NlpD
MTVDWRLLRIHAACLLLSVACAKPPPACTDPAACAPPSASCVEGVCGTLAGEGQATVFRVENRNPVVVTVFVDFPVRENFETATPFPVEATVPAGARLEIARFVPAEPGRGGRLRASERVVIGSLRTVPDPSARYALPFGGSEPCEVGQGVDGGVTHVGIFRYAFDFTMPVGTPVLAARTGTVAKVIDGFTKGGVTESMKHQGNAVIVAHSDGTMASYGHLSPGIPVREGQRVEVGQRLGLSGATGYARGPHLHFHVGKILEDVEGVTIPIRFDDGTREGYVPQPNRSYGPGIETAARR